MNSSTKNRKKPFNSFFRISPLKDEPNSKRNLFPFGTNLGTIYHHYRENLTELGIAYEGMLYRNVIEQLDTDQLKYDKYIFVGFNVLNKVENEFFRKLKDAGKALFYWDYDIFYTQQIRKHEAGEFLKRNLGNFRTNFRKAFSIPSKNRKNTLYFRFHRECTSPFPPRMDQNDYGQSFTNR